MPSIFVLIGHKPKVVAPHRARRWNCALKVERESIFKNKSSFHHLDLSCFDIVLRSTGDRFIPPF